MKRDELYKNYSKPNCRSLLLAIHNLNAFFHKTTDAIKNFHDFLVLVSDSDVLEKFLIHSKNSLERAKGKLESYYSARSTVPDMFQDRDPLDPAIREIAKVT